MNMKTFTTHNEIQQLKADFKEAIEAFKELLLESLNNYDGMPNSQRRAAESYYKDDIKIIEKAYGESWEDIRREK